MPILRKTLSLDNGGIPIDRSGGEDVHYSASGGLFFEAETPDVGVQVSFDDGNDRFPVKPGRKYAIPFKKLRFFHSGVTGTVSFITFECGEDVDDSSRRVASADPGTKLPLDAALDFSYIIQHVAAAYDGIAIGGSARNTKDSVQLAASARTVFGNNAGVFALRENRKCLRFPAVSGGKSSVHAQEASCSPILDKPLSKARASLDGIRVWRYRALVAAEAPAAALAGDVGLFLVANHTTSTANIDTVNASAGFGIGLSNDGQWRVQIRKTYTGGVGVYSKETANLTSFDTTKFALLEIRVFSATETTDAYVEFWIDGKKVHTESSWADLPGHNQNAMSTGFLPNVVNGSQRTGVPVPVANVYCAGFRVQAGRNIEAILSVDD